MLKTVISLPFFLLLSGILGGCSQQGDILYVDEAVVRLNPVPENPSAGYMKIHGGDVRVKLQGVTSDFVQRIEMHETITKDGIASMNPAEQMDVPAGETVSFEPGGKHIMIWGISGSSIEKGLLPIQMVFSNGDNILVNAVIEKAGEAAQ